MIIRYLILTSLSSPYKRQFFKSKHPSNSYLSTCKSTILHENKCCVVKSPPSWLSYLATCQHLLRSTAKRTAECDATHENGLSELMGGLYVNTWPQILYRVLCQHSSGDFLRCMVSLCHWPNHIICQLAFMGSPSLSSFSLMIISGQLFIPWYFFDLLMIAVAAPMALVWWSH